VYRTAGEQKHLRKRTGFLSLACRAAARQEPLSVRGVPPHKMKDSLGWGLQRKRLLLAGGQDGGWRYASVPVVHRSGTESQGGAKKENKEGLGEGRGGHRFLD